MSLFLILAVLGQPPPAAMPDSLARQPKPVYVARTSLHDALSVRGKRDEPDHWLAMDKFWHFSASFVTVGAAYHLGANRIKMPSPWPTGLALGGTLTLGVCKEFSDLAGPSRHFSWKDLVADAAGIGVGYFAFIHHF